MNELKRDDRIIAAEINAIKTAARATMVTSAIEIGKRLAEAKELVPVGKWGKWLEENVDYSTRTAQNLMACWEEYGKKGDTQAIADLNMSNAVALLSVRPDQRKALIESGEASELSVRDLQKRIEELKAEDAKKQVRIDELLGEQNETESARARAMDALGKANKAIEEKNVAEVRAADALKEAQERREEVAALKKELADAEERLKAAENKKPETIEVTAYAVPPEVEKELEELRAKASKAPNEAVIKVRDGYGRALKEFEGVKALIGTLEEADKAKFKAAIAAGLKKMAEMIEGA